MFYILICVNLWLRVVHIALVAPVEVMFAENYIVQLF